MMLVLPAVAMHRSERALPAKGHIPRSPLPVGVTACPSTHYTQGAMD